MEAYFHAGGLRTYCEETVPGLMMGSRRVTSRIGWVRMKKASTEAVYAARAVKIAAIFILLSRKRCSSQGVVVWALCAGD